MSVRSPFLQNMYKKLIEPVKCDRIIFIPMIDGLNLTATQIKKYENLNYCLPTYDHITPLINSAIRKQNVDFFLDERSHAERNSIQLRVICAKVLQFEYQEVKVYPKLNSKSVAACIPCCSANNNTRSSQNIGDLEPKIILQSPAK